MLKKLLYLRIVREICVMAFVFEWGQNAWDNSSRLEGKARCCSGGQIGSCSRFEGKETHHRLPPEERKDLTMIN